MFLNEFDNFNSGSLKLSWTRFDVSTSSTSSTSLTRTLSEVEVSRMVTSTRFGVSASLNDLNENTELVEVSRMVPSASSATKGQPSKLRTKKLACLPQGRDNKLRPLSLSKWSKCKKKPPNFLGG